MYRISTRLLATLLASLAGVLSLAGTASAIQVTSVADTGGFNPDEMAINRATGALYVTGTQTGSDIDQIGGIGNGGISIIYSQLPSQTPPGYEQYTNGFEVHQGQLWWNNANAGPGFATQISHASLTGGPISSSAPTDDLDFLTSNGTTLITSYYAGGAPFAVDGSGNLSGLAGSLRGTVHISAVASGGSLYVVDGAGAYVHDIASGNNTTLVNAPGVYRTNGSRVDVGGGYLWALDANNAAGFWQISLANGQSTFLTDASFTHLNDIVYSDGIIYVDDTGGAGNGHVWAVNLAATTPVPEPATLSFLLAGAAGLVSRARSRRR